MLKKIINSIKNRTFFKSIKIRLRIVFRIKNRNVYSDYLKCQEYRKLEKKYLKIIKDGVNENLERFKSNKIWICWLQGIEDAPEIVRACVNSVKINLHDKEIIILDKSNIKKYIELPEYIERKWKKGIIPNAQYTDILRTALLCKYGGGWIDATVLCTASNLPDYIEKSKLFVYSQMDLYGNKKDITPILISNWMIFSESNNPILLLTLTLLYSYWKDYKKLTNYFIYHLFFSMSCRRYSNIWRQVPVFNNHSPHTLQYEILNRYSDNRWKQIIEMSDFHKLNRRIVDNNDNKSFYNYIINKYLNLK